MVSHRLVGSITRSVGPGETVGALTFSASQPGMRASSSSQSHTPSAPVTYSQPRPAGAARVRMVSNTPAAESTVIASNCGCSRTRCWVRTVPAVSA
ncbi:Uncharacterised protein [Mycobacteroides abscessus subsp. abscessus]|nr:Uncharacterised protein [Mycobacteroides abscessus subsp. abscessus]